MIQCHRYDIFSYLIVLQYSLVINLDYMLGIMTRPAINRQDTLNLLYAETGQIKLLRIISRHNINHGGLTVSCKVNMHDGIADQVFKLAYYKAF